MPFPATRMRRLRRTGLLRGMVRETELTPAHLVQPLFVELGTDSRTPIEAMPGVDRLSISHAVEEAGAVHDLGVPAVLLFGIPAHKDDQASGAYDEEGVVQLATRAIKEALPELVVITDVCLCEYTSHGHCGVVRPDGQVDNDMTLELLAKTAISQAEAGADAVAPSDMMDGRVGALRTKLDAEGHSETPIIAYSAKFASAFYGPFREAADSTPAFGDRRSYQMDPANADEAVREALLDVEEGAAVPLVDLDRRLLNLLQGSFPLEPRPFAAVAAAAGVPEDEVLARSRSLIDDRIIRQITPIFDTRALGYTSMLVAAKVDPDNPHRAAAVINAHPGVSHNYLRNHEFNLWFTIAVEPDSKLGLEGTLEVLAREAGADSVRQLPTLKLFKIRMDLEMEGDTDALASAAEVAEPIDLDPQPYDELDIAVIRALQGDMAVVQEPYAAAASEMGLTQERFLDHLAGMQERGLLRRVAAILYHRRAGFSANGMGVWQVPEEQILEVGRQMAAVRGI